MIFFLANNRAEEANPILKKIAKVNGIKSYVTPTTNDTEEKLLVDNKWLNANGSSSQDDATKSSAEDSSVSEEFDFRMVKYLVTPVNNLIKTSILLYIWAALMLLYYGISLGVLSVDLVNPYLMYILSVVAEILGCTCKYYY